MSGETLWNLYRQGISQIETNPDEAIRLLAEGSAKAEELGDTYYKVLLDHWQLQAMILYKHDFNAANKLAIKAAIDARAPVYRNYQEYICIQQDLILVYQGIDPIGYAPEIKEAIDLMLDSTTPTMQCHHCLKQTLVQYHIDKGEIEQANKYAMDYFIGTENRYYHRSFAAAMQCQLAHWQEDYDAVLSYAQIGITASENRTWTHYWLELKAWEMLALQKLGQPDQASINYKLITQELSYIRAVLNHRFYYAVLAYHEACDDLQTAISHWDNYLTHLENAGEHYWHFLAYLEQIRLLKQIDLPISASVEACKSIADNMRSREQMLTKLDQVLTN
ncbi:MAG: hypothetical protein AAF846_24300 [Chloroflexota bacterium]